VSSFSSQLLGLDGNQTGPHSLFAYSQYLYQVQQVRGRQNSNPLHGGGEEQADVPRRSETNRAANAVETAVFARGAVQNAAPPVIPPANEFRATRLQNSWVVVWRGQIVAVGPTKKRARRLARNGNSFLIDLQTQAITDAQAMSDQFSDYLGDATNPAGGFTPIMNTSFPT
jgi:hypothetical protein